MKKKFSVTCNPYLLLLFCIFCLNAGVSLAQSPSISSISPALGNVGTSVTISGTGFNSTAANNVVWFGSTKGTVTAASTTSLSVTVDSGAIYGFVTVLNRGSNLSGMSRQPFLPIFTSSYFTPGDINFKPKIDFTAGGSGNNPYIAAIADVDGDGKPDLVVNNRGDTGVAGNVIIYRNTSSPGTINTSSFVIADTISIGTVLPSNVKLADFDGDGKLDMVYSDQAAAKLSIYKNTSSVGSVSFGSVVDITVGTSGAGPNVLALNDYDGDGWIDIAFSASNANNIVVMRNNGTAGSISASSFATAVTYPVGVYPIGITAADFDNDGKPDIAVSCSTSNVVSVIRNTSVVGTIDASSFASRLNFTTGNTPVDLQYADINGDGKLDLLVSNNGDTTISIFPNSGSSGTISFSTRVSFRTGALPVGIGTGDINGDGKVDVVVTNPGLYPYSLSVYRNTSSGTITTSSLAARDSFMGGGAAYGVTVGDLDGDGYPDMITANPYYFNTISILRNYPLPNVDTISASGSTSICRTGGTVTLGNSVSGGTWISTNPSIATVSTTGTVTGRSPGIDTIIYRVIAGGDTNTASRIITVEAVPSPGTITGPSGVCVATNITLADTATGGTWSSTASAIASVSSAGVVRGIAVGSATISYSLANSCGTFAATKTVTVSSSPSAGTITGTMNVCTGANTTLADAVTGGTWTSASAAIATVSSAGVVTGVAVGSTIITYTVNNGCGVASDTALITVNAAPAPVTIGGATTLCQAATTTLTTTGTGGTWSSSNPAVASITGSGLLMGVTGGTAIITYTITNTCGSSTDTALVSITPLPLAGTITGASSMCIGVSTTSLSNATTGGVWSSSNIAVATINSTSGLVRAVAVGATNISYTVTNSCGSATTSIAFAVDSSLPSVAVITGPDSVCAGGATITLADAVTGGSWSSSNVAIASVNASGLVRGILSGNVTITYTVTNGCGSNDTTHALFVKALPSAGSVSGASTLCAGLTTTYTNSVAGGIWRSSSPSVASVTSAGVVRAVTAGTATISYSVTNSCGTADSTRVVTINPQPSAASITGPSSVCEGANITLANATTGGTWSSSNTAVATVSTAGVVRGITAGSVTITYRITNSCGTADSVRSITVNPAPTAGALSGATSVCQAANTTFTPSAAGGTWSSSAIGIATVNTTGDITGVAAGTATITYTVTNSCGTVFTTKGITVNPLPVPGTLSGPVTVCEAANISLTSSASGGSWTSSSIANATVSSAGVVTGIAAGSTIITYTATNSCGTRFTTRSINVLALPDAGVITGSSSVCQASTITLNDVATGGSWSSSAISIATVNTTGDVTGVAAGSVTISYVVTNSCGTDFAIKAVTVNPLPVHGTLSGTTPICTGATTAYSSTVPGGTWTTSNAAIASITTAGVARGVAAGTASLTYTVTNGCGSTFAFTGVTVIATPTSGTITGPSTVCAGSSITLTASGTVTSWSLTNSRATLGTASGVTIPVTGVAAGTDTLTYITTNTCGSATSAPKVITILPLPVAGAIYGPSIMCVGDNITLADTSASAIGTWSIASAAVATINPTTGQVYALASGTAIITYSVTTPSCGNASATFSVTVRNPPNAGPVQGIGRITGFDTVCAGTNDTLNNFGLGDYWVSSNTALATVSATTGIVYTAAIGAVTIFNIDSSACGADTFAFQLQIKGLQSAGIITGGDTSCAGLTVMLSDTASGGIWSSGNPAVASISPAGLVQAVSAGTAIISYGVTNSCGTSFATHPFHVLGLPDFTSAHTANSCDSNLFTYTPVSSVTAASFTWSRPAVAGISNSSSSGSGGISEYLDNTLLTPVNAVYTFITSSYGCTDTNLLTVTVSPIPKLLSAKTDSICSGATFVYRDTISTGSTTTANWSRAAVAGISPSTSFGSHGISEALINTTVSTINVVYVYTLGFNGCSSTASVTVKVAPSPVFPHITTHSPNTLCSQVYGMNFGTTPAPFGVRYDWSASGGAAVWATGIDRQYCLVNFPSSGGNWVYLKASLAGSGCVGIDSFGVNVLGSIAQRPEVIYFNTNFVCQMNTADSYQWGYDDKVTLDSTILPGETNQNYTNLAPETAKRHYWVITSRYGCIQKSYFNEPTTVQNINSDAGSSMQVVPNPTTGVIKLSISSLLEQKATVVITNAIGQKVKELTVRTNETNEILLDVAAGVYFINATTAAEKLSTKVIVTR